jgi:hypothetical protein
MSRTILVEPTGDSAYRVTVNDGGSRTEHTVTARAVDVVRYAPDASAERLIEASFEFLLEREPKEAILRRFDLPVIEQYFPEYARTIRSRVPR